LTPADTKVEARVANENVSLGTELANTGIEMLELIIGEEIRMFPALKV